MYGAAGHSCDNRGTGEPQDMKKVGELIQGMSRIERLLHADSQAVHWSQAAAMTTGRRMLSLVMMGVVLYG